MVGSTFGVAVMGAIVTTIGRSKLDQSLPHVPPLQRGAIVSALGSGSAPGHASTQVLTAVQQAFVSALRAGFLVGAAVTLVASVLAWMLIERRVAAAQERVIEEPA
jgi:hypothetical protein